MIWYFRKLAPSTAVVMQPQNIKLQFTSVDGGLTGYFATNREDIANFFKQCIAEQRYGLTEVPELEFVEEYVKKKKGKELDRLRPWDRESIGANGLNKGQGPFAIVSPERVAAVVGLVGSDVQRNAGMLATLEDVPTTPAVTAKAEQPEIKPTVGKRAALKKKESE